VGEEKEIYRMAHPLKINDIVKINQQFFDYYNREDYDLNDIKDETFIIIDMRSNIMFLDKNVLNHSNEVHRIYLDKIEDTINKTDSTQIKYKKEVKEIKLISIPQIVQPKIKIQEQPRVTVPTTQSKHNFIIEEFQKELAAQNEFFESDNNDLLTKYYTQINKLKISNYEKNQLKNKIEKIIKEL